MTDPKYGSWMPECEGCHIIIIQSLFEGVRYLTRKYPPVVEMGGQEVHLLTVFFVHVTAFPKSLIPPHTSGCEVEKLPWPWSLFPLV